MLYLYSGISPAMQPDSLKKDSNCAVKDLLVALIRELVSFLSFLPLIIYKYKVAEDSTSVMLTCECFNIDAITISSNAKPLKSRL